MNVHLIGIAGGSGSGKSTFTDMLKTRFPDEVSVIYHDNYYRDQSDVPLEERAKVNYDHPDALETDLLYGHLLALKKGEAITCPVYDLSCHNRSDKLLTVEPKPFIIVEGILVLTDDRLRDLFDLKIYVDADPDERILRRILRDVKERGRDLEGIIDQYLTTVKPMHYHYVEPYKSKADIVLNSGKNEQAFAMAEAWIQNHIKEDQEP